MAAEANDSYALERLKELKATPHDPAEVQKLLAALGFNPGPRPGSKTADAIRKFQQSRGLPVDGTASLRLVGQLREAMKQKTAAAKTDAGGQASSNPSGKAKQPDLEHLRDLQRLD
jgi:peptidoglycan hydrolase-like protein with peptidoglycan-binding domain